MYVEDLDIPRNRIGDPARRIIDRAIEESWRHAHALLTSEHLLLAGALLEWELLADVMRSVGVNPHDILCGVEDHLRAETSLTGGELRVAPTAKLVCRLAPLVATRAGRHH
jgi:hypothetical protein